MDTFNKELQNMSDVDLVKKMYELKNQYFSLKLNASTAHIKDYSQFKKLRRSIAQVMTALHKRSK